MPAAPATSAPSFEALLDRPDLVWMGQNTTHLEPPAAVLDALTESIRRHEFQVYAPAGGFAQLREAIADDLGLPDLGVWLTDGAVGGLHHLCTTLAPRISRLITSDPGWPWPGRFATVAGVPVDVLPVYDRPRRLLSVEQISAVIEESSLLYLIDPLNPLGSSYTQEELTAITDLARATNSYVVQDATYRHFADAHTLAASLYPERTFTTYSFSKWLGLAGLRLGAVAAAPELLAELTTVPANPLGSSIVGQRAAIAGLQVKGPWLTEVRATNRRNLDAIERVVADSGFGTVVVPRSQGNFLSIDISGSSWDADELCAAFLERDVFIRPGTYQSPAFGRRFVKVSTSVPAAWADRFTAVWEELGEQERNGR